MKNNKGFVHPEILIVIILIAVFGLAILILRDSCFVHGFVLLPDGKNVCLTPTLSEFLGLKPKLSPTPVQTDEVGTSNWKTYRNEEYGLEIKYPPEWNIKENRLDEKDNYPTIYLYNNEKGVGIRPIEWEQGDTFDEKAQFDYDYNIGSTSTGVGGYDPYETKVVKSSFGKGIKYDTNFKAEKSEGTLTWIYYALEENRMLKISSTSFNSSNETEYNQILSTFEFIED